MVVVWSGSAEYKKLRRPSVGGNPRTPWRRRSPDCKPPCYTRLNPYRQRPAMAATHRVVGAVSPGGPQRSGLTRWPPASRTSRFPPVCRQAATSGTVSDTEMTPATVRFRLRVPNPKARNERRRVVPPQSVSRDPQGVKHQVAVAGEHRMGSRCDAGLACAALRRARGDQIDDALRRAPRRCPRADARRSYRIAIATSLATRPPTLCAPATVAHSSVLQASPANHTRSPTGRRSTERNRYAPGRAEA